MSNFAHANKGTTYIVNHYLATKHIGIWCNGNTTDSGPVILGSSPSIPTKQSLFITNRLFFVFSPKHKYFTNTNKKSRNLTDMKIK